MYRGFCVDEEGLDKVRKYGTDRNPEDAEALALENQLSDARVLADEDFKAELDSYDERTKAEILKSVLSQEEDVSPDFIWALPRQGLETCITTYADPKAKPDSEGKSIPMILAYRAECLIQHQPNTSSDGQPISTLSKEELLDEFWAVYRFVEGKSASEAVVAAFRLVGE